VRSLEGWSKVLWLRGRGEEVEHNSWILGSGNFVQAVIQDAEEMISRQIWKRAMQSIEKIITRMCKESGVTENVAISATMRRRVSKLRAKIAWFLSREIGIPMAEIGRRLGVGASAVGMSIRRKSSWDTEQL